MSIFRVLFFLVSVYDIEAFELTPSPDQPILGENFSLICTINFTFVRFSRGNTTECIITGVNSDGTCETYDCNGYFNYNCNATSYALTIPGTFNIDVYHGTTWTCQSYFGGQDPYSQVYLEVRVTISSVSIMPSILVKYVGKKQTFTCTTDIGRPNARIQWYLSDGTNLTVSATQQPDCEPGCNKKVNSTSVLVYTGKRVDHGKALYCIASNVDGRSVISQNVTITIVYGPISVVFSPSTPSYTVTENTGSVGPIVCSADCTPNCTMTWSGPDLPGGITSVLNIPNIKRNQAGNYYCTARNIIENAIAGVIKVIVNYGPNNVLLSPSSLFYTVTEGSGSVGPIICTADCRPNCTMTWSGPNLPDGTASVLNLQNISRSQTGNYRCAASNIIAISNSAILTVTVSYGPNSVMLLPSALSYTVTETTGSIGPINCTADCRPICTMIWSGPNLPDTVTSVLNLQNINRTQAGDYRCTSRNDISSQTSRIVEVIVNYGPNDVVLHPSTVSYTVTETTGSVGPITCTADCQPNCTMTWSGPNLPDDTKSVLYLQNINRNQAGDYRCTASYSIGSLMYGMVTVDVHFGPSAVLVSPSITIYTVTETTGRVGPITCIADCRPKCTMIWSGPNLPSGTTSILNLQNINRNQAGDFICTASNTVSTTVSGIVTIVVNYVPTIRRIKGNNTVSENDSIELRCLVDSIPKSLITWKFKDGNSTTILLQENGPNFLVNGSLLKVSPINCLSMGIYSCEASNYIGVTKMDLNVGVMCAPRLNLKEYEIGVVVALREHEPLDITVPILSYPKPWLYWQFLKNQYVINVTKGVTNTHSVNRHTSRLFIHNLMEEDFGVYIINGGNGIGNSNTTLGSIHVMAARSPESPMNLVAICKSSFLILIWRSGFNGGGRQIFTVELTNTRTDDEIVSDRMTDPGYGKYVQFSSDTLDIGSEYRVLVRSANKYGQSNSTTNVTCKSTGKSISTDDTQSLPSYPAGIGTGLGIAALIVIITLATLFFIQMKRKSLSAPSSMYEETQCKAVPANIYNELGENTTDGKNETSTRRNDTDIPNMYENVVAYDNQVIISEHQEGPKKGGIPTTRVGGIYMNTEI